MDGYKLVPVELTDEMLGDAMGAYSAMGGKRHRFSNTLRPVWKAMLAAAPASPQAAQPVMREAEAAIKTLIGFEFEPDELQSVNAGDLLAVYLAGRSHAYAGEVERLRALRVTNIMLDVVPGDGSGHEVYARSVDEVVSRKRMGV